VPVKRSSRALYERFHGLSNLLEFPLLSQGSLYRNFAKHGPLQDVLNFATRA
jgi:hypothetical protein